MWLSYETLCQQTERVWEWLTKRVSVATMAPEDFEPLHMRKDERNETVDKQLLRNCDHLYQELLLSQMKTPV